jgi:hypothetical protein
MVADGSLDMDDATRELMRQEARRRGLILGAWVESEIRTSYNKFVCQQGTFPRLRSLHVWGTRLFRIANDNNPKR